MGRTQEAKFISRRYSIVLHESLPAFSATRGNGKGTSKAGRDFLSSLDLSRFRDVTIDDFRRELDMATNRLNDKLPNANWGLARKLINIFLRDVLYTKYLCEAFHFQKIELFLEIPLDSITADEIRTRVPDCLVPRWKGVKHLSPTLSHEYQLMASQLANNEGIARVHLDTYWWGQRPVYDESATE